MKKLKLYLTFCLFLSINFFSIGQTNLDSLQEKLFAYIDKNGYDTVSYKLAQELFDLSIDINPLTASQFAAIQQQIALELKDSILQAGSLNSSGLSYLYQNNYFMATEAFFKAYEIYRKLDLKYELAYTLLNIAASYYEQDIIDIAETKILNSIDIFKIIGDSIGVADANLALGKIFVNEDEEFSINYLLKAEKTFLSYKKDKKLADTYNYMSKAYLNLGKIDKSIDYITKALNINKQFNNELQIAESYIIFGDIFYEEDNFIKAQAYYVMAKEIYEKFSIYKQIANMFYKISQISFALENYYHSIEMANECISFAKLSDNLYLQSKANKIISDAYFKVNNIKLAYEFSTIYSLKLAEYYETKTGRNFSAFQMNLETQNKEQEIDFLKMKNEKDNLELEQKQYRRNRLFIIIVSVLIILYFIFIFYRSLERKKLANNLRIVNASLKDEVDFRKKAETEAQSNGERYKLLFRKTPIGILQFNENLTITDANERFFEIFRTSGEKLVNQHLNRIFDRSTTQKILKLLNSKEDVIKTQSEIPTKDEVIFVSVTIKKYNFWTQEGDVSGGIIIIEDYTEQKKQERFYKNNILSKQKLLKQVPDDLILIDNDENIIEIHFPDSPHKEVSVSKLSDIFNERHLTVFRSHLIIAKKNNKISQFFFNENQKNYLVRIIPDEENILISISHFEAEAQDAGIIVRNNDNIPKTNLEKYMKDIQDDIEQELLPIYQNIQKGLSFVMIKNFAEKIISLGKKHSNNKIIDFGEQFLDYVSSFNVAKVNEQLEKFPTLISEFMGFGSKFI